MGKKIAAGVYVCGLAVAIGVALTRLDSITLVLMAGMAIGAAAMIPVIVVLGIAAMHKPSGQAEELTMADWPAELPLPSVVFLQGPRQGPSDSDKPGDQ